MRKLFLISMMVFASIFVQAQPGMDESLPRNERIEAMKIAFLTEKLQLTPKEAQVFWPVYNEYDNKQEELRKNRKRGLRDAMENMDKISDKELEMIVDAEISFRQTELDLQKEYHDKFKKILPVRKVAKLYVAEHQFKKELLRKIKERRK